MAPSRPLTIATHPVHADAIALLRQRCEVDVCEQPPSPEMLATRVADASALLAFMPDRVDARLLDACPELRIVAGAFKGADNIDVEACTARGVWVTAVPDLLSASTGELAVGLLISVARRIREGDVAVRAGEFAGWRPGFHGMGLEGTTVGIVGMGSLGRAIARRLLGFGCHMAYTDPGVAAAESLTARPLEGAASEPRRGARGSTHSRDAQVDQRRTAGADATRRDSCERRARGSTVDEDAVGLGASLGTTRRLRRRRLCHGGPRGGAGAHSGTGGPSRAPPQCLYASPRVGRSGGPAGPSRCGPPRVSSRRSTETARTARSTPRSAEPAGR